MINNFDEDNESFKAFRKLCFDVLLENPGMEFGDWESTLINNHGDKMVDAFGDNPISACVQLADWWQTMDYTDPVTDINKLYSEWAEWFNCDSSVEIYRELSGIIESMKNNKD